MRPAWGFSWAGTPLLKIVGDERQDGPDDNEWTQENSFEIMAWSQGGNLLLLSQIQAKGDWDETTPIIYDFNMNQHWRVELAPLRKLVPADCNVVYRPVRFTDAERVLISARSTETDREPGTKACFPDSLWLLDFRHRSLAKGANPPPQKR